MSLNYGCDESHLAHYTVFQTPSALTIDGNLDKPAWQQAVKSGRFVDMVTGAPGWYDTRAAVLWDNDYLYFGIWVEEPFVRATQKQRDALIFLDNDVEVFIDGGDCYYELELNAFNTLYEVFFIWRDAYRRGGRFDVPEFDLYHPKTLSFGGDYDRSGNSFWWGRHPRGIRWAFLDWDMPGLQTAVKINGQINNDAVRDKGWQVEIAIPWQSMHWLANGRSLPPAEGDTWRVFVGRFQKLESSGTELQPHPAWAWNKHGVYDTHLPECFTYLHFTTALQQGMPGNVEIPGQPHS